MKALHNYVIYQIITDTSEEKKSAVILTTEEPVKYTKATVTSCGSLCKVIKEGNIILIPRYADEFKIGEESYWVCKEEDICAIF